MNDAFIWTQFFQKISSENIPSNKDCVVNAIEKLKRSGYTLKDQSDFNISAQIL